MNTIKAYLAGLFDGEGYIRINKVTFNDRNPRYQLMVGLNNTHKGVIDLLNFCYGGSVHYQDRSFVSDAHRPIWSWATSSKSAIPFLEAIRPWSGIKATQIDLALEFQAHVMNNRGKFSKYVDRADPERLASWEYREWAFHQMKHLKR